MNRARAAAAGAALALFGLLGVTLAATTPWRPLPGPVPGGRAAADAGLDFTRVEIARSAAFDAAITPPAYAGLIAGLAGALLLGLTPIGARLISVAVRPVRARPLRVAIAAITVTAVVWICGLPFAFWRETVLHRFGLSVQSRPEWLLDKVKGLGLTCVITVIALVLLYALIRRFPRYWWTGAAAGGFLLVVLVSFIFPVVVEPVFNSFTRLPPGPLRSELLRIARADGVPVQDVLVADASRRTTALNAYVSGFGSTRRIVVYDTLLTSAPAAEIESVVAHELGHAERGDVLYGTLTGALGLSGSVCLLYLALTSPRSLRRAGLLPDAGKPEPVDAEEPHADAEEPHPVDTVARAVADPRSVALLLAISTVLSQLGAPAQSLISRRIEARADVHALDLTLDPTTFVAMQRNLSVRNVSDLAPDPLEYVLWFSHPSGPERIAMARDWARLNRTAVPAPVVSPPSQVTPNHVTPNHVAPGSATPGSATPGSATPGSVAPAGG